MNLTLKEMYTAEVDAGPTYPPRMDEPKKLEAGTPVVTVPGFVKGATDGMDVAPEHLTCRTARANGRVVSTVPGHGDEVYLVRHQLGGTVAAYSYTEIELIETNGAASSVQAEPTEDSP